MPARPHHTAPYDDRQTYNYNSHITVNPQDLADELNGDESAASILQSVKEQEAQFDRLTRELEVERQSVATQLEKCKLGSETASMNSISSTDESFHWRPPPRSAQIDEEESDTDSKVSGSQLVDSCLRVLHERGLMGDIGEEPADYLRENDVSGTSYVAPPSNQHYQQHPAMNGQLGGSYNNMALNHMHSPNPSLQSGGSSVQVTQKTVTTVTKTMTSQHGSPRGPNHYGYSPMEGHRDAPTPTRGVDYPDQSGYNGSMTGDPRYPDQSQEGSGYPYGDRFDESQRPVGPDMSYQDYNTVAPQQDSYHGEPYPSDQHAHYSPRLEQYQDGAAPGGNYDDSRRYPDDSYDARPDNRYRDDRYDDHGNPYKDSQGANSPQRYPDLPPEEPPYGASDSRYDDDRYGDQPDGNQFRESPPDDRYRESPVIGSEPYRGDQYEHSPQGYQDGPPEGAPYASPYQDITENPYGGSQHPSVGYGPQGDDRSDRTASPPSDRRVGPYQASPLMYHPDRPDDPPHQTALLTAPPDRYDPDSIRRSPSMDSQNRDQRWRNPDLPEVIEFLSHPSNAIKANAAAYLQHLCYMDDSVKAKTGSLGGIPALVELVNNEIPEVQRAACGALRNLSYGRTNDDNKRAIKNAGGIAALVRLLRKSTDNDIRELVTGILWNLSSCQDLKKPIIDDGLTVLVNTVVIPHTGMDRGSDEMKSQDVVYWSTVFRNASGVLRNVSSDGEYARRKLRECEGLVKAVLKIVKAAIGKNDIDNKSVENCVCILRNLSYACQEVDDPEYHRKRKQASRQPVTSGESTGCFGPRKKKDAAKGSQKGKPETPYQNMLQSNPARSHMELLWHPDVVHIYLPLLSDCTNPETLEAAVGAVQNLAACHWQPSEQVRAAVRKEKGLPIIVELLNLEADRVVNAAAIALRNLAIDQRNKELTGKYAMKQLVAKLPCEGREPEYPISDDTICAIEATLYEVIKNASEFASSLLAEGGLQRLVYIANSKGKYSPKVVKFASSILYTMWQFKELHSEYKKHNLRESHFITKTMAARSVGLSPPGSADNTLSRPRMDQSGPTVAGYNENTLPYVNRHGGGANEGPPMGYMDDRTRPYEQDPYMNNRKTQEEMMMMNDLTLNSGRGGEIPGASPTFYSSIDGQPHNDPRRPDYIQHQDDYRPPGGVPLFSNLPPVGQQQPQPQDDRHEPLYAKVNKQHPHDHMILEQPPQEGAGGADSWV